MIAQKSSSQCLKISQNVAFEKFSILAFFINFCFITLNCDLSGNTFLAIEWDFFCDFWTLWSLTFFIWNNLSSLNDMLCSSLWQWKPMMHFDVSGYIQWRHSMPHKDQKRNSKDTFGPQCMKMTQNVAFFLAFFVLLKSDLSGNTVWRQASGFQKKKWHFWRFWVTFVQSLRLQC